MGYNPLINGIYWGEIAHLLTIDPIFLGHPSGGGWLKTVRFTTPPEVDSLIFLLDYATSEFFLLPHGFSHLASSPFIFDTSHFESFSSLQSFLHLDLLISICNFSRFDFSPFILAYLHLDLVTFSRSSAHTELSSSFFDAVRLASSLSARSFVCFEFSVLSYGAVNLDAWRTGPAWMSCWRLAKGWDQWVISPTYKWGILGL